MPSGHVIGFNHDLNQSKMADEMMGKTRARTRGDSQLVQFCVAKNSSLLPADNTVGCYMTCEL